MNEKKSTPKKLLDAIIISSLSSMIATVFGGMAFLVYSQAQTATDDIKDIQTNIEAMQKEVEKANDTIIGELAPLKAEHEAANKRFDEIGKFLKDGTGDFVLPKRPTYDDIKEEEDNLKDQFNQAQQMSPPM
jgi:septal ring factor EnvC (AmiA/AmiB activator)